MSATANSRMGLSDSDLNDTDRKILNILDDGRATPNLVRAVLAEQGTEVTRQYVSQRLKRLREHNHVEKLYDTSVYVITDDPRT